MAKKKTSNNSKDLIPIILLGGLGVGGYFLYKYFKEDEEEPLTGFQDLSIDFPSFATVGETVTGIIIGKNYEDKSHLCFIKLVDQETGELLTPTQSTEVGAGLSKQFLFEFIMPDKPSLRFNIPFGRIIDGNEQIDITPIRTITSEEGYPITISRPPYSFIVYNLTEEMRMKEFFGIDPIGMDLDSFLINSTQEQRDFWRDFWVNIWTSLHRQDIVGFVINKYNQYSAEVSADITDLQVTIS